MTRSFTSFVLVFSLFGAHCHQAAPATTRHYELGNTYNYEYILGLELNEPNPNLSHNATESTLKTGSTVGYKVLSQVQVTPIWQHQPGAVILEILLVKPQLQIKSRTAPTPEGFRDHSSQLDSAALHPFYIYWKDGVIQNTYSVANDDTSILNIKKGIANLLQFQIGSESKTTEEFTTFGRCNVTYTKNNDHHQQYSKSLVRTSCQLPPSKFASKQRVSPVLGSTTESDISIKFSLTKDSVTIDESEVSETHIIRVNAKKEVGAVINGTQHIKFTGKSSAKSSPVSASTLLEAVQEIGKSKTLELLPDELIPTPENFPLCEGQSCKGPEGIAKFMRPENMATIKMATAFLQMTSKFRELSREEIGKILQANMGILPQLLDVCAAAGTLAAHQSAFSTLQFNNPDNIENPERYLLGLALSSSPEPTILPDLFDLVKNLKKKVTSEKLQESLVLTTSALVHTLRQSRQEGNSSSAIYTLGAEIEKHLIDSLGKCAKDKPECQQLYLRAFKNLKSQATVSKLFDLALNADPKTSVVAMKALHSFPDSFFNSTHRPILLKIVKHLGKKYDSSARTLAIDMILRNHPTKEEIRQFFLLLNHHDQHTTEVTTFMWHRVHEFMEGNANLKRWVPEIIKEENLETYHHLAPKGLSTAFSRTFTSNPSGNSTFSNAIEMNGKILKRSSFDVYVKNQDDTIQPLSLGIFANGLSSFASSDDEGKDPSPTPDPEEEEDATAGMELSLMGVQTRPIIFFVGKGELMGLVWSGAGSERTTALQGNALLQDERRQFPLYNGLVADINIQGGLSFDLAGLMQLSLWHRTANSLVENKAGLFLQSIIRADTSFVRSRVDYTLAAEAALHFTSDINFYDKILMCLKLTQPEFTVKQNVHKIERIPGSKHKLRKAKYKTIKVPGITYALNRKNSQLCGVMYKDEL